MVEKICERGRQSLQFWPMFIVPKRLYIRIPHGTEESLSLGDIVLDGDPAPSPKGAQPPIFGQCLLWPNGWMD